MNYLITCVRCEKSRKDATEAAKQQGDQDSELPPWFVYAGESSRGCTNRFEQHVAAYKSKSNFMWSHVEAVHGGEMGEDPSRDFSMQLKSKDTDPIRRILRESIRINSLRREEELGEGRSKTVVLNGKDEFFGVKVVQPQFIQE